MNFYGIWQSLFNLVYTSSITYIAYALFNNIRSRSSFVTGPPRLIITSVFIARKLLFEKSNGMIITRTVSKRSSMNINKIRKFKNIWRSK